MNNRLGDNSGSLPLDVECSTYDKKKDELLANHENKFVLIKGNDVIGIFNSIDEAIHNGAQKYGIQPFLVRPILKSHEAVRAPVLVAGFTYDNTAISD